jgi:plastocyanin
MLRIALLCSLGCVLLLGAVAGADVTVTVRDASGSPVADAVVYASGGSAGSASKATIDQVNKEYVPFVTAVQKGTRVTFPNHDQIRHHVYSFSDAKTFEIPLYKGTPADPVLFDQTGVVVLGCNIHDWMKAYVFVADTPHFAITDESGSARIAGLSGGKVSVWHPRLSGESPSKSVSGSGVEFIIEQKRSWRPRRAPSAGGSSYR